MVENRDPFKVLFPLGVLSGVFGVLLWIAFQKGGLSFFPRQAHANLMYFGLMASFVSGFLMTAIPRMTQSQDASYGELGWMAGLIIFQWFLNGSNEVLLSTIVFGVQIASLVFFVVRRFGRKRRVPFEGFYFIPFAFICSFLGLAWFWLSGGTDFRVLYLLTGEAFLTNLILGLGSRMIPVLRRLPGALTPLESGATKGNRGLYELLGLALLLNLGFILQASQGFGALGQMGVALRTFVFVWFAFRYFRIQVNSPVFTVVGEALRIGVLGVLVAHGLELYGASLHGMHIFYILGFGLITIMVGTRVMLAHGDVDLDYELKSKRLGFVALLFVFAAAFRWWAEADFMGRSVHGAAWCLAFALLTWLHKFLKIHYRWNGFESVRKYIFRAIPKAPIRESR